MRLAGSKLRALVVMCQVCQRRRSPEDFYHGNRSTCRACVKDRVAKWRANNPDASAAHQRDYRRRKRLGKQLRDALLWAYLRADMERAWPVIESFEQRNDLEPGTVLNNVDAWLR